jgi:hypothetical protein
MTSIVTNAFQELPTTLNSRSITFSGALSTDSQGRTIASAECTITGFNWTLLSKPDNAPDPTFVLSGTLDSDLTITIPGSQSGSFLYLLTLIENSVETPLSLLTAPNSAFAVASLTSPELDLHLLAEGERFHADRSNSNLIKLENAIKALRSDVTDAGNMPYATTARLGSVKLNEAAASGVESDQPAVVYAEGSLWKTLSEGGVATGLHTHPEYENQGGGGGGTGGVYHILRPDLLTGPHDKSYSGDGISTIIPLDSTNSAAETGANFGSSTDGNLILDVDKAQSSTILLNDVKQETGNFFAIIDVLVSPVTSEAQRLNRLENAEAINTHWEVMLAAEARDDSTGQYLVDAYNPLFIDKPSNVAAVGMVLHDWTPKAMEFGTHPFRNTFNDVGNDRPVLTKAFPSGGLTSRVLLGVKRLGDSLRTFISVDDGGFYPTGDVVDISNIAYSHISLYLSARCPMANVGLRIETTGIRVLTGLDQFGAAPNFNPA